jgi:hypothetical protein
MVMSKVPTMGMSRWAMAGSNDAWKKGTHPSFTRMPKAPCPMTHRDTDAERPMEGAGGHAGREVMDAEVGSM